VKYLAWLFPAVVCLASGACSTKEFVTDLYYDSGAPAGGAGGRGGSAGRGGSGGRGGSSATAGTSGAPATGGTTGGTMAPPTAGSGPPAGTGGTGAPPPPPPSDGPAADVTAPPPSARAFRLDGVANWKGNAEGAYSIVHEILCDPGLTGPFRIAEPELTKRGLRGGFGVLAGSCGSGGNWAKVKTLVMNGHDVFSNTMSNVCLTGNNTLAMGAGCPANGRSTNYATQIDMAAMLLQQQAGVNPGFLLLPYDVCDPMAITRARQAGHIGARCGGNTGGGINATAFADPFKIVFDLWGPGYSTYRTGAPCMGVAAGAARPTGTPQACRTHVLTKFLDDIAAKKGWGLRGFHGFDDDQTTFQSISTGDYQAHLDVLAQRVMMNQLWVDGPTVVVKYRMARTSCMPPAVDGATLKFPMPAAECTKHATELSYLVRTADGADLPALKITQGTKQTTARKLGPGQFVVDADPTKGDAVLSE
jgi:hypothetical protein